MVKNVFIAIGRNHVNFAVYDDHANIDLKTIDA